MGKREITVHCIAQTRTNPHEMREWLDAVGATEFELPPDVTDAEALVGVCAKRCYNSFEVGLNPNVTKIRTDWAEYLDNVLASGHGSVTEHATWTWAIEGCTRVMTAEANRHRAGVAISEASMRYIRFEEDIAYWEPISIRAGGDDVVLAGKKAMTRQRFAEIFEIVRVRYRELCEIWRDELAPESKFAAKKALTSMMRRIVPMGCSTGAVYTLNVRSLRHVMTMRCSPAAEEEIAYAFGQIAKRMCEEELKLFGDFEQVEGGFWVPKYKKV